MTTEHAAGTSPQTMEPTYDEAIAAADKAYREAIAAADKAYREAIAPTDKAYLEATAAADKAYYEATAAADKAYREARAAAGKAYGEATELAVKAYREARAAAHVTTEHAAGTSPHDTTALPDAAITGIDLMAAERRRQVADEGYTPEHDAEHADGALALAAACYATPVAYRKTISFASNLSADRGSWYSDIPVLWPWHPGYWKPASRVRMLVKAGALIAAEIDRLLAQGESHE